MDRVDGIGSRTPHTPQPDLLPFLPSLEVQSAPFARGDTTTVQPNKNFLSVSSLEGGGGG